MVGQQEFEDTLADCSLNSIQSLLSPRALLLHRVELSQLHHRGDEGEILGGEEEPC